MKFYHDEVNDVLEMKVKLEDLGPYIRFYWSCNQGFGGHRIEKESSMPDKVVIVEYGCDGNQYIEYEEDKNKEVWIEIGKCSHYPRGHV
jgi:hypothetical protein